MTSTIKLNTGDELPQIGLGFWKVDNAETPRVVQDAVAAGYRHLDCACDYGNEAEVGDGIRSVIGDSRCKREDLWVTSKLWNTYHASRYVRPAVEKSLSDLGLDYLDLYLIHFPIALAYVPFEDRYPPGWFYDPDADEPYMKKVSIPVAETWQAMESLVDAGLVRNIGLSNFNCQGIRDVLSYARIAPSVLQVELHPYLAQEKLIRYCTSEGIAVTGFSPLGALSYFSLGMAGPDQSVIDQPVIRNIADTIGKTPAQVVLRWGVQRGTSIIPKTSRPERMAENIAIFDFELSADQMNAITALDQGHRFNDPGVFCESAFNTYFPIYE